MIDTNIWWIVKILHDPEYLIPWELYYYSILRSCRIFSINSIEIPNNAPPMRPADVHICFGLGLGRQPAK